MTRRALIILIAVLLAGLAAYSAVTHWLAWRFAAGDWPVPPGTPWTYQLESGFIPALTVLTLLGTVAGMWHKVNCHERRCPRIGRHTVDGTPWCKRHQGKAREAAGRNVTLADVSAQLGEIAALLRTGPRP